MSVDKSDIFDRIKGLVEAFNLANQYDREMSCEAIVDSPYFTYEGKAVYLLRQIFSAFVEATGQRINDGVILSLIESSTLIRRKPCCLTFDPEKKKISYKVPEQTNRSFSLGVYEGRVVFKQNDREGSISCHLENGDSISGTIKTDDGRYTFATQFQENGLLKDVLYTKKLYTKPSSYAPSFFGNIGDINLSHRVSYSGNTISCIDKISSGSVENNNERILSEDKNVYGVTSSYSLVKPSIPGFGKTISDKLGFATLSNFVEIAFPELFGIAKNNYNAAKRS